MLDQFSHAHRPAIEDIVLTVAAITWGLAVGVSLATFWILPAPPDQLPGFMTSAGLDSRGPLRAVLTVICCVVLAACAARPLTKRLAEGQPWAKVAVVAALVSALWAAIADPFDVIFSVLAPAAFALTFLLLRDVDARFTRRDVILVPASLTVFIALPTLLPSFSAAALAMISAFAVVVVRVALDSRPFRGVDAASAFSLAPLAMVILVAVMFGRSVTMSIASLLWVFLSPVVLRFTPSSGQMQQWIRRALTFVIFPLVVIAYPQTFSPASIDRAPHVDLFEDGHSLLPASEMLRGERPYVDIVPGHGLVSDGLLDYAMMRLGAKDIGSVLTSTGLTSSIIFPAAVYAVALAASGSAEVAVLACLLGFALPISGRVWAQSNVAALFDAHWLRAAPSLFSLSLSIAALRYRKASYLFAAMAVAVLAGLTSIEFGTFAVILGAVGVARSRSKKALIAAASGLAIAGGLAVTAFAIFGFAAAFFRVTLLEILPLQPAYNIGVVLLSARYDEWLGFPDIAGLLFYPKAAWIVCWGVVAITTIAGFFLSRSRRLEGLWLTGAWSIVTAISYAERLHTYFMLVVPVFIAVAAAMLLRRKATRPAGWVLVAVVLVAALPAQHLSKIAKSRRGEGISKSELVRLDEPPRARGALYRKDNAEKFVAAREFVEHALAPGETFFDFANMPILYYLLDRPCPIRQYDAGFIEPRALQEEVVATLERDATVRAALVSFPNLGETTMDGVPNSVRAPIVWKYLQEHFQRAYVKDGVEFWMRR